MPNKHLYDGIDWIGQDDYIVGNVEGLNELREAISKAIDSGEASTNIGDFLGSEGDFQGVRCLDGEFFKENNRAMQGSEFIEKLKVYGFFGSGIHPFYSRDKSNN